MIEISPDQIVYWSWRFVTLNATIVFSWVVMIVLVTIALLGTRRLSSGPSVPRWQNILETLVTYIRNQIREITQQDTDRYLPFIGTLFLFISISNLLHIVPGYHPPTGSLSTTGALAIAVFFAVPAFGMMEHGVIGYLKHFSQPSPIMIPFNIIGEFSRTIGLAVRLFGNIMSMDMILVVLLSVMPIFVPVLMQVLGLLLGQIQAYIFAILATVYIGAATASHNHKIKA